MKNDLILVVGASGTVGSRLVSRLKKLGYRTRATTSKPVPPTESLVTVDLVSGKGIKDAFEGVDKAFFLSPPGYTDQHAILSPLIQEAKRRGLKKVVLMTALGVNANDAAPLRKAEIDLEKSGLNYNIIRPNWFLQNFNTFWIQQINSQNKIMLPAGNAKVSFIDAEDIASVAAKLLTSDQFDRQAFDLTGAETLDHQQVAEALSKATGRKIEYREITPEEMKKSLISAGIPSDYADLMLMLFSYVREGYNAHITSSVRDITGAQPRTLVQYANDNKQSWIK